MGYKETVSVIIPAYNRAKTIHRAITSALEQSLPPIEVIVVDDGSTDDTVALVNSVGDERIRCIETRLNRGAQYARIKGILTATGDYLVFLDSDDELLPDSIFLRLLALRNSECSEALVYGDVLRNELTDRFEYLNGISYSYLLKELSLCPFSTMLIPKPCFSITGFPDVDFPSWQDDDMVLTIGKHFPVIHCGSPVARMNVLDNRISGNKWVVVEGCRRMVDKYSAEILQVHGRFRLFCWKVRIMRSTLIARWDDVNLRLQKKYSFFDLLRLFFLSVARVVVRILLTPFFSHFYG